MKSLNTKLSLLLLSLFIIVAIALSVITRYSTVQYNLEITQRLNGSIAEYLTQEEPLIINGKYNEKALKRIAHQSMVINPTVEVYLLNLNGEILSFNLPKNSVLLKKVPLEPIHQFLKADSKRPLLNKDPRSPENNKTFSVAKVTNNGTDEGYVYVILGGKKYEELAKNLNKNYILKLALSAIIAVVLLALLIGVLMLMKLTKPLKILRDKVIVFQKSSSIKGDENYKGDEIQQLNQAFDDMSKRISNQIQQIKKSDKNRRDLITNVSHDLRTPLSSMQGYLDTLLIKHDKLDDQTTKEYLSIAKKHCLRLNSMINDLFEFSKLDSHSIKPLFEVFSVSELMQDVAMEFKPLAQHKNIELTIDVASKNTNVRADIGLMQRVFENLISNSINHTDENGKISIILENLKDGVNVSISDNGHGISENNLPNIFNRLYQADNHSLDSNSSSGLGLSIVKKIMEIHGIHIHVESQLNKGTRFNFIMPYA